MSQVLEQPPVVSDGQELSEPTSPAGSALGTWAAWLVVNGLVGALALVVVRPASTLLFIAYLGFVTFAGFFLIAALLAAAVGLAAGLGQAWVLRRRLVSVKRWLGTTLGGWLLGILVGTAVTSGLVMSGTGPRESTDIEHAGPILVGAMLYGAVVGTLVGLLQTMAYPATGQRRSWWVVASGLGSVAAFGVGMAVALTGITNLSEPSPMAFLGGLVGGLVYGLITAPALPQRQPTNDDRPAGLT